MKEKQMIFSVNTKNPETRERAYKVNTSRQLQKLNQTFGTDEVIYPAIYVDMFGMLTISLQSEEALRNVGYDIIVL